MVSARRALIVLAWEVASPGPLSGHPLRMVERRPPHPGPGQVRVQVSTCGVCRTDLHVTEGDLPVHQPNVVPGHEIVGVVDELGTNSSRFTPGDRIGIAWLADTCGRCRFCRRGDENLCTEATFTGWDHDGGYAESALVDERYAYRIPDGLSDDQAAPLLCAGLIGYRSLRRTGLRPGGRLGIYGFGGSAHLTAQVALHEGAEIHVMTRSEDARQLALDLGAASAGPVDSQPPVPLDAAIVFAPAGELVPVALAALDRGGVVVIAGIHLTDIPRLRYQDHLFNEREIRSVTANTRRDGEEFLQLATRMGVTATTTAYPLDRADRALADLAGDRLTGAAVLHVRGAT